MLIKTKGIVLRNFKYRESSLIVDIFTLELGMRSYLINGVRSSKSKSSANLYQVMSQLDLLVYNKKPTGLNRIKECKAHKIYKKIPFDVVRVLVGQMMVEILRKTIKADESNEFIYFFIVDWFNFLDNTEERISNLIPCFLIELASHIGYAFEPVEEGEWYFDLQEGQFNRNSPPHFYHLDEELSHTLNLLLKISKEDVHQIKIPSNKRSELIDKLLIFFRLHVEGFGELKSLSILRDILA